MDSFRAFRVKHSYGLNISSACTTSPVPLPKVYKSRSGVFISMDGSQAHSNTPACRVGTFADARLPEREGVEMGLDTACKSACATPVLDMVIL